jgi:hypothetical protein
MDAWEREERYLEEEYENGNISQRELIRGLNDLARDYRESARESAERAYQDEMERW